MMPGFQEDDGDAKGGDEVSSSRRMGVLATIKAQSFSSATMREITSRR